MFINGEWVDSVSGETFQDMNPATGELFAEVPKANLEDADRALEAAFNARAVWANTPPENGPGCCTRLQPCCLNVKRNSPMSLSVKAAPCSAKPCLKPGMSPTSSHRR